MWYAIFRVLASIDQMRQYMIVMAGKEKAKLPNENRKAYYQDLSDVKLKV